MKANFLFGSHTTYKTSVPEKASTDWKPNWHEGDEVVATMMLYEEELIVMGRKIRLRHIRF